MSEIARECLEALGDQLRRLKRQILTFDQRINAWHRSSETAVGSTNSPGSARRWQPRWSPVSPIRECFDRDATSQPGWTRAEAKLQWRQGEARQLTKQGDRYLRSLFCAGALAVIRYAKIHGTKHRPWLAKLLERRPTKVAAIASQTDLRVACGNDAQGRALQGTLSRWLARARRLRDEIAR